MLLLPYTVIFKGIFDYYCSILHYIYESLLVKVQHDKISQSSTH